MQANELKQREDFLKRIAIEAGQVAVEGFNQLKPGTFTLKGTQDYLTEVDAKVEQFIRDKINDTFFLDDAILGEELGGSPHHPRLWVIDPIDGTANFARNIPHFCIAIAFVNEGVTELGCIYNPCTQELYMAKRGEYCHKNGHPMQISQTENLNAATIEFGWSARVSNEDYLNTFQKLLHTGVNIRRGGSGALALAWVAEGRTDGYVELSMNAWDCLAGLLMIREAGGVTGDYPKTIDEIAMHRPIIGMTPAIAQKISDASGISLEKIS